ncbi:NAD-dependent epimerase/dehydratase family protein [Rathayibacter sp. VKM Ac-2754]|uniref:NAD-dependent epimerase/dehydratase family protein n=1 Tax=Rathayibacter sp. VKM Ac-2754 TaxID=2609251 RepID=UPI0013573940|nr:NAD(P)-dependent oxidoreductase [Rathayibacter sp. VKM Ac-2754]MWV59401.1 NAD-dependent epimerase/dehydratase family protein [Rathayibacter sp. VKM Ac-2754]
MRIAVTGCSGTLGTATLERLLADGHDVIGLDRVPPSVSVPFTRVDFTDYGQALDAVLGVTARHSGVDAIVHLAAIPVNGLVPDATTFHSNMTVSFNVFHAALRAGVQRIVYASSITAMGFPFLEPPASLPLTEEGGDRANNTYGLVKILEEAMAKQLVRWDAECSITALRFTNVTRAGEYRRFVERAGDPAYRRDLLWSYIDARDGASAIARALEAGSPGFAVYDIAASDTGSTIPSAELVAGAFPEVPLTRALEGFETVVSIDQARAGLGWEPVHLWRGEAELEGAL